MSDLTNAGDGAEGTASDGSTQNDSSAPSAEYKVLQRKLSEKDLTIRELASRVRELEPKPDVQELLTRSEAARAQLEAQVRIEKLKVQNPGLSDVIEALALNGTIPDETLVETLKSKIGSSASSSSSGMRNNPARPPQTESDKMDDILKNGSLFS